MGRSHKRRGRNAASPIEYSQPPPSIGNQNQEFTGRKLAIAMIAKKLESVSGKELATLLAHFHEEVPIVQVAELCEVNPSTLHRHKAFKLLKGLQKSSKPHRGSKDKNGNLEAIREEEDERES